MQGLIDNRYKILHRLASRKGFASPSSLLVEDLQVNNRKNVIKLFPQINSNQQKRFLELQAILSNVVFRRLNVSLLVNCGVKKKYGYLVFDYIKGNSLQGLISNKKKFSATEAELLLIELLEILKPIHETGFVLNNIEPSNLVIRSQDQKVFVINFDAIRKINSLRKAAFCSSYAPLEQQSGIVSVQNDLYAIGMIVIQVLTGQKNIQNLKRNSCGEIILLKMLKIRSRFKNVLISLTHENSTYRYSSVAEVFEELKRIEKTLKVSPGYQNNREGTYEDIKMPKEVSNFSWYARALMLILVCIVSSFTGGYIIARKFLLQPAAELPLIDIDRVSKEKFFDEQ